MFEADTIAAIATAMTNSGIGIIRVSGSDAIDIVDKIFVSNKGKKLSMVKTHTIHYGSIVYKGKIIDEVLVSVMKAPNSYTKEDVVEINCHGGTVVLNKVLELILISGARPAEPGEFTKRAFLNGRIDLSQAEAVIDIINSKNEYALSNSVRQLKGSISREISKLHESVFVGKISQALENTSLFKGEFVIVVSPNEEEIVDDMSIVDRVNMYIRTGLTSMEAIKKVAKERKLPKNEVYKEYHGGN